MPVRDFRLRRHAGDGSSMEIGFADKGDEGSDAVILNVSRTGILIDMRNTRTISNRIARDELPKQASIATASNQRTVLLNEHRK